MGVPHTFYDNGVTQSYDVSLLDANFSYLETNGTWTPAFTAATVGDLSITYSSQTGVWYKHGNLALLDFQLQTSAFTYTTASGNAKITGIPSALISTATIIAVGTMIWSGITKAGYTNIIPVIATSISNSYLTMSASGSAQTTATLAITDFPTGGTVNLRGNIWYILS